ncbi:MAG: T9SS type A sorting domain-containing protein [Chitinophagaceae bacterium]|nr:MAG: T9SS type A sorting domain-containing protein [Chitinophagaceae bacterium]
MRPFYALLKGAALLLGIGFSTVLSAQSVTNVTRSTSFSTIQAAINDAQTVNGDVIVVGAGTYMEDVNVNKGVRISGVDPQTVIVAGIPGGSGTTMQISASNVILEKMTVTRMGNNPVQWNDPTLNSAGIALQGLAITNAEIRYMNITGNRTGIDINNSGLHNIHHNYIGNNRTGMIFRNQTDNVIVAYNVISDNWTVGVLFLDASGGTNSPVQQASGSTFGGNTIKDNWYGDVVDRQSGGSLPTPGTNAKNFLCTTFGTATPVVTTANSAEPGYAAQIPVAFGGSATAPGGQPNIAGPASANIFYTIAPAVSISYSGTPYCANTGTAMPTQTGPTAGFTYSSTPAGLSINATTGAIDLAASQPGTYAIGYTDGCSFAGTTVVIRPQILSAIPNGSYCAGAMAPATAMPGTAGVTYSWTNSNTAIGLAASGTGDIPAFTTTNSGSTPIMGTITVTSSAGAGCNARVVYRITVKPVPVLSNLPGGSVCAGSMIGSLSYISSVPGTTVSWTNDNTNTGIAAMGTGNIPAMTAQNNTGVMQTSTITATPSVGGCTGNAITTMVTVHPSISAISYPGSPYCQTGPAVPTRSGSDGGTWSATPAGLALNSATGSVNLGASTPGTYNVTYDVTASGGCSASASTSITINAQATVDPIPNQVYCQNMATAIVPFTGTAPSFTWANTNTSIGLAASGSGTSLPSFTTANAGPGVQYAYVRVSPVGNGSTLCPGKGFTFRFAINNCPPIAQPGDTGGDANTQRTALQQAFQVGPNPARGSVALNFSGAQDGPFTVQIVSQYGMPLGRTATMSSSSYTLDLSGLTPGSYLLKVTQVKTGISFNKQLIKL